MQEQLIDAFRELYRREPTLIVRAPGRVNLLGAHVDYNDGWVLPTAIDRSIWLAAAPNEDGAVHISSLDFGQEGEADLDALKHGTKPPGNDAAGLAWLNYPAGVAWVMMDAGLELVGLDAVLAGNIPIGAGVSSSAAVEVAFILAWEALAGLQLSGVERARLGQRVENVYLGLGSGIMDQFACLHGVANHLILLDCRTLEHSLIPLPADTAILVADSRVRRQLAHSEYNLRRQQCREALAILKQYLPHILALRDVEIAQFERYAHHLPEVLQKRARHVVEECARVLEGVKSLQEKDLAAFGQIIQRSHISSRDLYEVSIPELDLLASTAWQTPGGYGARLTGGGFGGCVVALVNKDATTDVEQAMSDAFNDQFGQPPIVYTCQAAPGASCHFL